MSEVLARWNALEHGQAVTEILSCCGSQAWAERIAAGRPFEDAASLFSAADEAWRKAETEDWLEAFTSHPRIGESSTNLPAAALAATWSRQEQRNVSAAQDQVKLALAEKNRAYEEKFGHIFIVCATGKSAEEILEILRRRLQNEPAAELGEAAEEQRKITQLRLKKWLGV